MSPQLGQSTALGIDQLSAENLNKLEECEKEQHSFRTLIESSTKYSQIEKDVAQFRTLDDFNRFWEQTNGAKEGFDRAHEMGCGLCSRRYQGLANEVEGFMQDFEPILDLVRSAGAPYGELAVGTVSVLFAVASRKYELEKSLAKTISEIKSRLPGLRMYQQIYSDNHELDYALQNKIVLTYAGFIEFCIKTTQYYKGTGRRRWLVAFGKPSALMDIVEQMNETALDVRRLCEELLSKNVESVKQLNLALSEEIARLQAKNDDDNISEIQRYFHLDTFSAEGQSKDLENHRRVIESDDLLYGGGMFQQMHGELFDLLKAHEGWRTWITSKESCLLVLSGHNNEAVTGTDQCWLSPVAVAMINELDQQTNQQFHAYYVLPQRGILLYEVLGTMLLQLLRQKKHALRDTGQYAEFKAELHRFQDTNNRPKADEYDKTSAFQEVALRVMSFFEESETVYITVDRADRCRLVLKTDHRKALMRALVRLVEDARPKVKILVIVDRGSWPVEDHEDELGTKVKGKVIVRRVEQGFDGDELQCRSPSKSV